ncbi:MAG: transglycosylase domain-containing protein, partial [Anaerolineae bacterium]|nr:transglycosylase domain-containing protein [Anaerolineae bacterium]
HGGSHTPIALDKIPSACINATVAVEDANFYQHRGVDFAALARAIWINVQGGEILSGGSTITQQLARNLLLSPEERTQVTLRRKIREMVLAWRLTTTYSKDDILTLYVNESNYGNLAYGIQAAAQSYFAKNASDMDLAECALLAGLPQAPAYYNPLENPVAAHERQRTVLDLMVKQGMITPEEADLAAIEELGFASTPFPIEAPHFVMLVRQQLEREFGREAIYTLGLQATTTLDLDAQHAAEQAVQRRLAQLAETRRGLTPHNVNNAAIVVLDPNTGEVLALVGSPDYFDPRIDGAVNAAVTLRQPGSAIKPITYAAAFDPTQPEPLTAATMMVDVRTSFVTREGDPYVPRNYDRQWHGPVLLRQALASSYNLIATKVLDHVGIETMTGLARSMGITTFDDADRIGLAITLGGSEVRLLELTSAYGAFANGGMQVEPMMISRVADVDGHVLKAWDGGPGARVMDERTAYLISDILSDNMARAPAFGEGSALRLSRPSAAKTGTTTDWRDNWTIGYTPDLVVG